MFVNICYVSSLEKIDLIDEVKNIILKYRVKLKLKGFYKVKVSGDIPYNFMSVDGDGEQTAYLISLDYVGCDEMATGKDYKRFESEHFVLKSYRFVNIKRLREYYYKLLSTNKVENANKKLIKEFKERY